MADDTIHRGVIEVVVDGRMVSIGIQEIRSALEKFEQQAVSTGAKAGGAFAGIAKDAEDSSKKIDAVTKRYMASVQREIAKALSGSRADFKQWETDFKGINDVKLTGLIDTLRQAEKAQEALANAARAAANAQREGDAARNFSTRIGAPVSAGQEQVDVTRTGLVGSLAEARSDLIALANAENFAAGQAEPLIAKINKLTQDLDELALAQHRVAQADRDAAAASAQSKDAKDAFIAKVKQRVETASFKTPEDALTAEASKVGATAETEQLIAALRKQRIEEEQLAKATREQAQAEREAAQAKAARDAFVSRVKEKFDNRFGLQSEADLLQLAAAENKVTVETAAMIAGLREAKVVQDALAQSAKSLAQAERDISRRDNSFVGPPTKPHAELDSTRAGLIESLEQTKRQIKELGAAATGAQLEPLVAQLRELTAGLDSAAAADQRLVQADREAAQSAQQAKMARDAFAQSLQKKFNDRFGLNTQEDLLELAAAEHQVTVENAAMIAGLREAKVVQEALGQAARAEAQAQRDAAQAASQRTSAGVGGSITVPPIALAIDDSALDKTRTALVAAIADVKSQLKALGNASVGAATDVGPLTAKLQELTRDLDGVAAAQQKVNAQQSYLSSLQTRVSGIGKTAADLEEMRAAQLGVSAAAAPMVARLREAEKGIINTGLSARQTAAAMRLLPAQITDIVVSLASGQPAYLVALQQGGQLKDSFGGLGNASKALGGALLRFVTNPLTLLGAAVATVAYGFVAGSKETDEYTKSILLTGNAAGTTASELAFMAGSVSSIVGSTGAAAEALAELAGTGRIAGGNLDQFAETAVRMQRVTGKAVKQTVEEFVALAKAPTEASRKLNETYHFLTGSVYAQIKALEEQGRVTEAAALAQQTYASVSNSRLAKAESDVSGVARAWQNLTDQINRAIDAVKKFGRQEAPGAQLKTAEEELAARQQRGPTNALTADSHEKGNQRLRDQIALLKSSERETGRLAARDREIAVATEDSAKAQDEIARIRKESATDQDKINKGLEEYRRQIRAIRNDPSINDNTPGGELLRKKIDPKLIAKDEADIIARFTKNGSIGRIEKPKDNTESLLAVNVDRIKNELEQVTGAYRNAESIMEAVRSAGLVSEEEYYNYKRTLIQLNSDVTIKALEDQNKLIREQQDLLNAKRPTLKGNDVVELDDKILKHQKEIADNEAKIGVLRAKSTSELEVLRIREKAALSDVVRSYKEARLAAEEYLAAQELAQERGLANLSRGPRANENEAGRNQIIDRFQERRNTLLSNKQLAELTGPLNADAKKQFDDLLALTYEFQAKELASYERTQQRKLELEANFLTGANRALETYAENSRDVASQIEGLFTNAFQGMEDALVEFTTTGKLDFKGLVDSILKDINRIIIRQQITEPLAAFIQGGLKSGSGLGGLLGDGLGALIGGGSKAASITQSGAQEAFRATEIAAQNVTGSLVEMTGTTSAVSTVLGALPATAAVPATTALGALALAANSAATALLSVAATSGNSSSLSSLGSLFGSFGGGSGGLIPGGVGSTPYGDGGYTGNLPVGQRAGIVHGQEFVFSAPAVKAIGVAPLTRLHEDAINHRLPPVAREASDGDAGDKYRSSVLGFAQGLPAAQGIAGSVFTKLLEKHPVAKNLFGGFFNLLGSDSKPGLLGLLGFSDGGYTGDAPATKVAGEVHGQEFVFSAPAVNVLGVPVLERMHDAARAGKFEGATKYHGGGVAGGASKPNLAPNEVPAILLRNEEVLTADDPRHRDNIPSRLLSMIEKSSIESIVKGERGSNSYRGGSKVASELVPTYHMGGVVKYYHGGGVAGGVGGAGGLGGAGGAAFAGAAGGAASGGDGGSASAFGGVALGGAGGQGGIASALGGDGGAAIGGSGGAGIGGDATSIGGSAFLSQAAIPAIKVGGVEVSYGTAESWIGPASPAAPGHTDVLRESSVLRTIADRREIERQLLSSGGGEKQTHSRVAHAARAPHGAEVQTQYGFGHTALVAQGPLTLTAIGGDTRSLANAIGAHDTLRTDRLEIERQSILSGASRSTVSLANRAPLLGVATDAIAARALLPAAEAAPLTYSLTNVSPIVRESELSGGVGSLETRVENGASPTRFDLQMGTPRSSDVTRAFGRSIGGTPALVGVATDPLNFSLVYASPTPLQSPASGGVESRNAAVSQESRSTLEGARKGSAAIAPLVTASLHGEHAVGVAPHPLTELPRSVTGTESSEPTWDKQTERLIRVAGRRSATGTLTIPVIHGRGDANNLLRGSSTAERGAHNPEAAGSTPAPATVWIFNGRGATAAVSDTADKGSTPFGRTSHETHLLRLVAASQQASQGESPTRQWQALEPIWSANQVASQFQMPAVLPQLSATPLQIARQVTGESLGSIAYSIGGGNAYGGIGGNGGAGSIVHVPVERQSILSGGVESRNTAKAATIGGYYRGSESRAGEVAESPGLPRNAANSVRHTVDVERRGLVDIGNRAPATTIAEIASGPLIFAAQQISALQAIGGAGGPGGAATAFGGLGGASSSRSEAFGYGGGDAKSYGGLANAVGGGLSVGGRGGDAIGGDAVVNALLSAVSGAGGVGGDASSIGGDAKSITSAFINALGGKGGLGGDAVFRSSSVALSRLFGSDASITQREPTQITPRFAGFFARGGYLGAGQWGIAGENGPEPVIGPAQIVPNRDNDKPQPEKTNTVHQTNTFHFAGPVDRRTQEQFAATAYRAALRANRSN